MSSSELPSSSLKKPQTFFDRLPRKAGRIARIVGLCLLAGGLFAILAGLEPGGDWANVLQPSTRAFLHGNDPYAEQAFLSPPWAFVFLVPPALLPPHLGSALFALIGAAGYLLAIARIRPRPAVLLFLVATPGFLAALVNPNFDWAVALGYTLPPQIGLFFVLIKPQISAPLVLFWLVEAWRNGGFRKVLWVFAPVGIAYLVSFLIFGPWVFHVGYALTSPSNTANVFPYGLLAGTALLATSIRQRKENLAMMAGPFFSPYLAPYSWLPALIALSPNTMETIAACIAYWAAWLISTQ